MKAIIVTIAVLLPTVALANSTLRHDPRLEQAAADIVATKMGEIRSGFQPDDAPEFVTGSLTERANGTADMGWVNGLATAREMPGHRVGKL